MALILELENFQGPFDLLLDLLREQELDITDVSLSKVTEDFLNHLSRLNLDIDEMNSFLYVAAKLALNKSKAIINTGPDEDDEISLSEALLKYQAIKDQAEILSRLAKKPFVAKQTQAYSIERPAFINVDLVKNSYGVILKNNQDKARTQYIKTSKDDLGRAKKEFTKHITKLQNFSVDEILDNSNNKTEAVIYFVTILEMLKSGSLTINNDRLNIGAIA